MKKWNIPYVAQDLCEKLGLNANPFDTNPLAANETFLPISEALVGREFESRESQGLTNILRSPGGGRVLIEGKIGVGKTTFVNYHRYIWENHSRDPLFTTRKEISISSDWHLQNFLINILTAIMSKLLQKNSEKQLSKIPVFKEVLSLSKILFNTSYNVQASLMSVGVAYGGGEDVNIPNLPEVKLLEYLEDLVIEIKKKGYAGLFLHLDNLELLNRENLRQSQNFFEEIRDALQIKDIYFVFVAKRGFFREVISPLQRVRSIFFGRPIVVPPLSLEQVVEVLDRRYQLLALNPDKFVPPVENSFIEYLYDLYEGKLRYVMDAMNMLLPMISRSTSHRVSTEDARQELAYLVMEEVREQLTHQEWQIFRHCVEQKEITNKDLQREFQIPSSNVTRIMNRFSEIDLIYLDRKEGRNLFYKVSEFARIIKDYQLNERGISKERKTTETSLNKKQPRRKQRIKKALEIIRRAGEIQPQDYARLLQVSKPTATRDLQELVQMGKVTFRIEGKRKYYSLKKS